jgi:hypothetical protein
MNPSNQPVAHLTDAQFTDLLLGTIPPDVIAHLETCPHCAEEAQRVSGALGSFAQQSRLWAERRAAARPAQTPTRQAPFVWLGVPPVAWLAATLILAAGIGLFHRAQRPFSAPQQVAAIQSASQGHAAAATVTPATLKADNALLSAINGELSANAAPSASAYGLTASHRSTRSQPASGISN